MLVFIVIASLLVAQVPIINKYTALINTFIHEIGHALMAIVTFGEVYRIKLNVDTSGYATTGSKWWVGRVLTTFAGYPFSLLFPSVMLYLVQHDESKSVLWILIVLLAMSVTLWIRDFISLIWCISILVTLIGIIHFDIDAKLPMIALMTISLSAAARSTYDILLLSVIQSKNSGDAYGLFRSTLIPPQIWGLVFLLMGITVPVYTLWMIFGHAPDYYKFILNFVNMLQHIKINL